MKKQKTKQASGAGQKQEAEEPLPMPTLGLVAEEERFEDSFSPSLRRL
jgi:hypothetical protein